MDTDNLETRLARRAKTGDRGAFEDLVQMYNDKIYRLCYRMLGNRQEAEDVVQETFLRVFRNLDRYDETMKFSTWIYRIATNLCIDLLRKRKNEFSLDETSSAENETNNFHGILADDEPSPENMALLSETQSNVRNAIESLPKKYKTVVILKYLHDMSLQEISEVLDLPVSTVKTRVHRGREYLRKKIGEEDI